jgi:PKHD-type hydroxylase
MTKHITVANEQLSAEVGFKDLSNPPEAVDPNAIKTNNQFTSIIHTSFFSPEQCEAIINACEKPLWIQGEVNEGQIDKKLRNVRQQGLMMNEEGWPHTRILELMKQANEARYKFNVSGFMNYDAPMIMEYGKGCHYDWHIDVGKAVPNRKLSFTIQLSKPEDYEGGDLEFLGTEVKSNDFRQQGTCVIFPSFLAHKISKVKSGTRMSIVGWVHGPTYE